MQAIINVGSMQVIIRAVQMQAIIRAILLQAIICATLMQAIIPTPLLRASINVVLRVILNELTSSECVAYTQKYLQEHDDGCLNTNTLTVNGYMYTTLYFTKIPETSMQEAVM